MVIIDHTLWCEGCGVEITWSPVVIKGHHYCCLDCAAGRACECAAMTEREDERRGESFAQNAILTRYEA